jgi:uncharacterized protein (TIGR03435 family)
MSIKREGDGATMKGPGGVTQKVTMSNGMMHMELNKTSMDAMAEALSRFVDRPVVNMTDLKGNYQVTLDLTMEDLMRVARSAGVNLPGGPPAAAAGDAKPGDSASDPGESSIFRSVQEMGLSLDARKAPIEQIVVDHAEKVPTEN